MSLGFLLIHGYTGSSKDLSLLKTHIQSIYPEIEVCNITLPDHHLDSTPTFSQKKYLDAIKTHVNELEKNHAKIIFLGHSTGGNLLLQFLNTWEGIPADVILVATPKHIDIKYLQRWSVHSDFNNTSDFGSLAELIHLINQTGSLIFKKAFPIAVIHGIKDELVPVEESIAWRKNFCGPFQRILIPDAKHHIFNENNSPLAFETIARRIHDVIKIEHSSSNPELYELMQTDKALDLFLKYSPASVFHLEKSPSFLQFCNKKPDIKAVIDAEPVIANIEITRRCQLTCPFCARTQLKVQNEDMDLDVFCRILDRLPHAYKITLVGLGEPLLHHQILEFIHEGVKRKKHMALVTNAMGLSQKMAMGLLGSGLQSITFSLDGVDDDVVQKTRTGSNINLILKNIQYMIERSNSYQNFYTSVFSAVSIDSFSSLDKLINRAVRLKVNAIMVSDLNFGVNAGKTLWKNMDVEPPENLRKAVKEALTKNIPVLNVRSLEAFGIQKNFLNYMLISDKSLRVRSEKHTWCYSPWQTVPIDVFGNVTICDCQPENRIGNILSKPLNDIWNGMKMKNYRNAMIGNKPPDTCRLCPRF